MDPNAHINNCSYLNVSQTSPSCWTHTNLIWMAELRYNIDGSLRPETDLEAAERTRPRRGPVCGMSQRYSSITCRFTVYFERLGPAPRNLTYRKKKPSREQRSLFHSMGSLYLSRRTRNLMSVDGRGRTCGGWRSIGCFLGGVGKLLFSEGRRNMMSSKVRLLCVVSVFVINHIDVIWVWERKPFKYNTKQNNTIM